MRIIVLTTQIFFTRGGAEIHADSLIEALRREGHQAELVAIPFKWYPPEKILDNLLACRLIDITQSNGAPVDRVIGLRYPAYHIPHPDKVLWILHQYRTAFDLWGKPECDLGFFPDGHGVRDAIETSERRLLPEARKIYANSKNVAGRLEQFCGIKAEPLYHPPKNAERFVSGPCGDFFFYPSRICSLKRQELVLRALAKTSKDVRVVFSGTADEPFVFEKIKELARKLRIESRIEWLGRISDDELIRRYSTCRAVIFPPRDEDYGYVTLEGMLSSKAVITCRDSGGPLEFVEDGVNGLVADADPESLAFAMDRMWREKDFAIEAGKNGRWKIDSMDIDWKNVVRKLLA